MMTKLPSDQSEGPDLGRPGSVRAFMGLVFVLSVPLWPVGVLFNRLLERGAPAYPVVNLAWHVGLAFVPMAAALILTRREGGRDGVRRLLKMPFDAAGVARKAWLGPILLLFPLLMLVEYAWLSRAGRPLPVLLGPSVPLIPVLFAVFFAAGIGEELGWTGYAFGPLQERWGALGAAAILGVASVGLHLVPLVIDGHPPAWIAWHLAHMVPYRVVLAWVYNITGRSLFAVIAFHAASNIGEVVWPFAGGEGYDPFITAVFVTVTAAVITIVWGQRTLARTGSGGPRPPR